MKDWLALLLMVVKHVGAQENLMVKDTQVQGNINSMAERQLKACLRDRACPNETYPATLTSFQSRLCVPCNAAVLAALHLIWGHQKGSRAARAAEFAQAHQSCFGPHSRVDTC